MSEAPRVDLNNTDTEFDLSAPTNPYQQTSSPGQKSSQMDNTTAPRANGNPNSDLQNSAIKAKDSLVESKVSATRPIHCRDPT
jgi:hypothetical protein